MKQLFILFVLAVTEMQAGAQPHPKTKELVDSVAAGVCRCMNEVLTTVDDDVKTLIARAISDTANGQGEIQNYLAHVGGERAASILLQFQLLGSADSGLTACINASTQRFKNLQVALEGLPQNEQQRVALELETDEKIIALVMEGISTRGDCGFAYQFINLGLELLQK